MTLEAKPKPEAQTAPTNTPPTPRPFKRPIKDVPLASPVLTKINVRKHKDKDVDSLAATIRIAGLLQPIGVRPMSDGAYEVVFGERRTLAICTRKATLARTWCKPSLLKTAMMQPPSKRWPPRGPGSSRH